MSNAQILVTELYAKGSLPALDGSVGAICNLTDNPLTCVADLTEVILRDCSLTSNLIATANSTLYGASEPITTISAAIGTLGFDLVRSLSMGLGIIKRASECARNRNLYRLFVGAYFSGMLSLALARRLNKDVPEELFVTGILSGLPRLLLANAFPDKYAAMEKKVASGQSDLNSACIEAFGVTYPELACEIARFWNLPGSVIQILKGQEKEPLLVLMAEAGRIADMMFGSARSGAAALKAIEHKLQVTMQDKDFQLGQFITDTCMADPNTSRFFKLTREDVEMMVRIVEWGKVNPAEVANLLTFGAAQQEFQQTAQEEPALIVGQILTDLILGARSATDVNEILLTAMEGIYRCLRPTAVLVAFPSQTSRRLEGRHCLGAPKGTSVTEFQVPLDDPASVVTQCLASRRLLTISIQRSMPLPFLTSLGAGRALLVPIVALGKGIGLYLIVRPNAEPFTKQEETWCSAMVEHVGLAFERVKATKTAPGAR